MRNNKKKSGIKYLTPIFVLLGIITILIGYCFNNKVIIFLLNILILLLIFFIVGFLIMGILSIIISSIADYYFYNHLNSTEFEIYKLRNTKGFASIYEEFYDDNELKEAHKKIDKVFNKYKILKWFI